MSTSTSIQWTDATWNPITGCTKVSEGCRNCYAEKIAHRGLSRFQGGRKFTEVRCHVEALDHPLKWKKPRRIFVNSMSDLFHESVPDDFIDEVFAVMIRAHRHTFQILTKRPERMLEYLALPPLPKKRWEDVTVRRWGMHLGAPVPPNIWLGVSVENQKAADERIPLLVKTPAWVRFLSCEPLLGPLDLRPWLADKWHGECSGCNYPDPLGETHQLGTREHPASRLDWIIVGGESGPGARPCNLAWIEEIVRDCKGANVRCFVKQFGAKPYHECNIQDERGDFVSTAVIPFPKLKARKGDDPTEWPSMFRVQEFPS